MTAQPIEDLRANVRHELGYCLYNTSKDCLHEPAGPECEKEIDRLMQLIEAYVETERAAARVDTVQFAQGVIRDALIPKSDVRKLTRVYAVDTLLEKFIEQLQHPAPETKPNK